MASGGKAIYPLLNQLREVSGCSEWRRAGCWVRAVTCREMKMPFGNQLKAARILAGMEQSQLAREARIDPLTLMHHHSHSGQSHHHDHAMSPKGLVPNRKQSGPRLMPPCCRTGRSTKRR
jgi:hypothetical protein